MSALWFENALLPDGWARHVRIVIEAGRIASVTAGSPAEAEDERHANALPGIGNLHSHCFQRGMAGLAERRGPTSDSFWTWREVMYRFAERIGPEELQAIAALAFMEMLEGGFTHVGEFHYVHHDRDGRPFDDLAEMALRIAAAADETGIGLTLLPVLYAASGFGGQAPQPQQRRFINDIDRYQRLVAAIRAGCGGDVVVGVAPHSLRAVPAGDFPMLAAIADGGPIHIHIAEQLREVDDCIGWSGKRPVEWLFDNVAVDDRWCLVHATHVTGGELQAIVNSGAVAGLCPITEANLGDGIFPARDHVAAGGIFGVGTDSNVRIDAAEELRSLEYSQRLLHRARNVIADPAVQSTGRVLFDHAVQGGARALGLGVHGIRVGATADMMALDHCHPTLDGKYEDDLLNGWIFGGGGEMVQTVWSKGRRLVENGRHVARDAIVGRYRDALRALGE